MEGSKTKVEKQGSWLGLSVLLCGGICLVGTLWCALNFSCKCSKRTTQSVEQLQTYKSNILNLNYLRRKVGNITHEDAKTHESVFRDLIVTILDKADKAGALWALFENRNLFEDMIFKRLNVEIKKIYRGSRIPTHSHAFVNGVIANVDLLLDNVSRVLQNMIVTRFEVSAIDQLRSLERTRQEDDLTFFSRPYTI